jgi:nitrate reductase gamma subunit
MSQAINGALFGIYPYICLSVFLIGSLIRFDREPYTWRSQSSQLLRRRQLMWGSNLFHVGILVILFGHTGGLLTPVVVFEALGISHTAKQLTAIVVGGVAGIMCLAGLLMLLHRRLSDSRIRRNSSFADIAVLVLLLAQLLLGLGTIFVSLNHLDGGEMVALMSWAQHIVTFRPGAADFVAHDPVPGVSIHPPGPYLERPDLVSRPAWLPDRANQAAGKGLGHGAPRPHQA